MEQQTYFRRGFGLKKTILPVLEADYHSRVVDDLKARGFSATYAGGVKIRLAEEFGFCYGVDRAVDYAYEATHKFPDRRIFLIGEIIHNPHVNLRMREKGIQFLLPGDDAEFDFSGIGEDDVVLLPAFGVRIQDLQRLKDLGCVLVDTTCGSVLNVWKRVESYAKDGFTALIHGKYTHEESRATASQVLKHDGGKYIIVRNMEEARLVMDYIERTEGALTREKFLEHFRHKATEGFDPGRDLVRIGVANQTTMLASDSLAIAEEVGKSLAKRYGEDQIEEHFRSFDTICSATQERQDAVLEMMKDPPEIMIVIGGYNSSNTNHLAHMCQQYTTTYHVSDATCIDVKAGTIRHKVDLSPTAPELTDEDWLREGSIEIGLTAGASTPNNKIGETIERVLMTRGVESFLPVDADPRADVSDAPIGNGDKEVHEVEPRGETPTAGVSRT